MKMLRCSSSLDKNAVLVSPDTKFHTGTAPSETENSEQRPPSRGASDSCLPSQHRPQAEMSEEKHS